MFSQPKTYTKVLKVLVSKFLAHLPASTSLIDSKIKQLQQDEFLPALGKIVESLESMMRIMKCLDYTWVYGLTNEWDKPASVEDCLEIVKYKGKNHCLSNLEARNGLSKLSR